MNNYSGNPWIIDTASAEPITRDLIRVRRIRWVGASTAAHSAIVTDQRGKVIWESLAPNPGANAPEMDSVTGGVNADGIVVPVLGSGRLYIGYN